MDKIPPAFERPRTRAGPKILLYEYGIRLPELDEESGRERALEMLEKAVWLPVRDAYEDYIHLDILDGLDALSGG